MITMGEMVTLVVYRVEERAHSYPVADDITSMAMTKLGLL